MPHRRRHKTSRCIIIRHTPRPDAPIVVEYMAVGSDWSEDATHARVFTTTGHAKNSIKSLPRWRRADDARYFVQLVDITPRGTAEEYTP